MSEFIKRESVWEVRCGGRLVAVEYSYALAVSKLMRVQSRSLLVARGNGWTISERSVDDE